jgi:hypothetical protein
MTLTADPPNNGPDLELGRAADLARDVVTGLPMTTTPPELLAYVRRVDRVLGGVPLLEDRRRVLRMLAIAYGVEP